MRPAERFLCRRDDAGGALHAELSGPAEDGVLLWRVLDPIRRHLIVRRRGLTSAEPVEALDYDALMVLALAAVGREGELGFADLLGLGLFPQLDPLGSVVSSPVAPDLFTSEEPGPDPGGTPPEGTRPPDPES